MNKQSAVDTLKDLFDRNDEIELIRNDEIKIIKFKKIYLYIEKGWKVTELQIRKKFFEKHFNTAYDEMKNK